MSLATRRIVSWLGTLVVLATCVGGVTRLPGAGGVIDELRWLLGQKRVPAVAFDRAGLLLLMAKEREPENGVNVFRSLLRDENPLVVQGALMNFADNFERHSALDALLQFRTPEAVAFADWFGTATIDEKIAFLPYTLLATDSLLQVWNLAPRFTPDDRRWMLAGTLERGSCWRARAEALVFDHPPATPEVCLRVRRLDESLGLDHTDCASAYRAVHPPGPDFEFSIEQLADALSDSNERVRWAAGRILTVTGDPRGLPAFREWLKAHPRITPEAERMLPDLFGADWRHSP